MRNGLSDHEGEFRAGKFDGRLRPETSQRKRTRSNRPSPLRDFSPSIAPASGSKIEASYFMGEVSYAISAAGARSPFYVLLLNCPLGPADSRRLHRNP